MKDITEELKKFIKDKGYTQELLASELGVTQQRVYQLLNGVKPFGKKTAEQWENHLGINAAWLLTGTGEMFASSLYCTISKIVASEVRQSMPLKLPAI